AELNALEPAQAALLTQHGFDVQRFKQLALRSLTAKIDNRVEGTVALPEPEDLAELPKDPKVRRELAAQAPLAVERGKCALIVLAGGMATRMGGVIKALVPAVDDHSFLDLRLREVASIGKGCPLWLMTSAATDAGLNAALSAHAELAGNVRTFQQNLSLRL